MNKTKLFVKSIVYSFKLVYRSSGLMLIIYLLLNILGSTLGLFETYALKYILDNLSATNPQIYLILESFRTVSGKIFTPVLEGTLYNMQGLVDASAIALKDSISPL